MVDFAHRNAMQLQSEQLFLRIRPSRIWYLKFILEGYDGIAVLSTKDRQTGLVLLRYHSALRNILMTLLAQLAPLIGGKPSDFGDK